MKVVVLGAGIMGNGIGQIAAMAGHDVVLCDINADALEKARATINKSLQRLIKSEKLDAAGAAAAEERISVATDLAVGTSGADVVVEAVTEVLEVKHQVLEIAAANAAPTALLGTNTSQLSITRIAKPLGDAAERVIGMHFFNPPVVMRLIELICGLRTIPETLERARSFAEGLGKEVVVCKKDSPGFITSRAGAILRLECLRMVEEGLATPEDIDTAIRLAFNHPMGPLELGDFNGHDTYLHAISSLETQFGERFKPTVGLRNMVESGRLGRKTGIGFYRYNADGEKLGPA
ncbi:MAG: 3-hydroxyacyl-CoA dehydrogenase family protein [Acidimicrobiia bacterium]